MATHLPQADRRVLQASPIARSRALLICLGLGLGAFGCANEVVTDGDVDVHVVDPSADLMVYGGVEDNDEQAVPGVVALRVGTGGTFELCSGALVAPNLVLTARHCVSKNVTTSVSCDENGRSANGKHISAEGDPTIIGIYTGATPNFARKPDASGQAIVTPRGAYLCNSDIALVVLDQTIDSVAPVAVRLQSTARVGETIRAVGYGQNDQGAPIGTRYRKGGVSVLAQGRTVSESGTPLGTHEFEVGRSICQGDSGGPAISEESLAVIGVVSRGSGCDDDFGHIYTTTSGFEELFDEAFAIAGSAPILEVSTAAGDSPPTQPQSTGQNPAESPSESSNTESCAAGRGGSRMPYAPLAAIGLAMSLLFRRRKTHR